MEHFQHFKARQVLPLPLIEDQGWRLKRYAILAEGREFDEDIVSSAAKSAIKRLPKAGGLADAVENHGIGFQIVHFAQVAVVAPVFYWQWGSVLAHSQQVRAPWDRPTAFSDGVSEVVGCVWEMDIVNFETHIWRDTMLTDVAKPEQRAQNYLKQQFTP